MSPAPRIGRPRSLEEREQQKIEETIERREQALDEAALAKAGTPPPPPEAPATAIAPEPEPTPEPTPEPVVEPETQLAAAERRYAQAEETLESATVALADAERELEQAKADHEATKADQVLRRHRGILEPALARAQRQRAHFLELFRVYGGASATNPARGTTHGPLAKYARTIPGGDARRREQLMELYKQAGVLMEKIRVGWNAAREACEACEKALTIGGTGDYAEFRLEQAGVACEAAMPHDPHAVEQACQKLIADIKAVDGEPGPEIVVTLSDTPRSLGQTHAVLDIGKTDPQ